MFDCWTVELFVGGCGRSLECPLLGKPHCQLGDSDCNGRAPFSRSFVCLVRSFSRSFSRSFVRSVCPFEHRSNDLCRHFRGNRYGIGSTRHRLVVDNEWNEKALGLAAVDGRRRKACAKCTAAATHACSLQQLTVHCRRFECSLVPNRWLLAERTTFLVGTSRKWQGSHLHARRRV